MPSDRELLTSKIQALPAEQIAAVEEFVDFITSKYRRLEELDRLLALGGALKALLALRPNDTRNGVVSRSTGHT
jgi:hypothetical protein